MIVEKKSKKQRYFANNAEKSRKNGSMKGVLARRLKSKPVSLTPVKLPEDRDDAHRS